MNQARLKKILSYDANTGIFTWRERIGLRAAIGGRAGTVRANGYESMGIGGRRYYSHRLAWLYVTGNWPAAQIDHIDRNPLNNAFCNLRLATPAENRQNTLKRVDNTSGYKGVTFNKGVGKWRAQLKVGGKHVWVSDHLFLRDAARAYAHAAAKYHTHSPMAQK